MTDFGEDFDLSFQVLHQFGVLFWKDNFLDSVGKYIFVDSAK